MILAIQFQGRKSGANNINVDLSKRHVILLDHACVSVISMPNCIKENSGNGIKPRLFESSLKLV